MKKWTINIVSCLLLLPSTASPQLMTVNDNSLASRYSFVRPVYNKINNAAALDSFYKKLLLLKTTNTGNVSIVHIGDSHIQADFLSGTVRTGLQDFFGNAGRGLVFPYQLAKSNAPEDISSSSNTTWQFNRVAHPEINLPYGISGYGITTNTENVNITLSIKDESSSFNRLKFFNEPDASKWTITVSNIDSLSTFSRKPEDSSFYYEVGLEKKATSFSLSLASADTKNFYGVSLENSNPGIIYHTIGVNGARYDQYNIASLFWKQLPALNADLYIISLGTNEAQAASFSEILFIKELTIFIEKLKQSSPGAAILITTAPDSYKSRRYYNTVLRSVNTAISNFCNRNKLPLWNLYQVTGGYKSAYGWSRRGLMSRDKVHFTAQGYRLQGALLLAALSKGYNSYVSTYPDK